MTWRTATLALLVLAGSMTIACGDGTTTSPDDGNPSVTATGTDVTAGAEQAESVLSSDGLIELKVPRGALPDGTTLQDLSIRPVPQDEIPTSAGLPAVVSYELLPNGLQLQTPVTVKLRVPVPDLSTTLFAYHVSADEWEPLTIDESDFTPEDNTLLLTASLSHFSYIHIFLGDDYSVSDRIDFDPVTVTISASASTLEFGEAVDVTAVVTAPASGLFWSRAPNAGNMQDGVFEVTAAEQPLLCPRPGGASGRVRPQSPRLAPGAPPWKQAQPQPQPQPQPQSQSQSQSQSPRRPSWGHVARGTPGRWIRMCSIQGVV